MKTSDRPKLKFTKVCSRCSGTGYLAVFGHKDDGLCYSCKGAGKVKATQAEHDRALRVAEIMQNSKIIWNATHTGCGKYGEYEFFISRTQVGLGYGRSKTAWAVTAHCSYYKGYLCSCATTEQAGRELCELFIEGEMTPSLINTTSNPCLVEYRRRFNIQEAV